MYTSIYIQTYATGRVKKTPAPGWKFDIRINVGMKIPNEYEKAKTIENCLLLLLLLFRFYTSLSIRKLCKALGAETGILYEYLSIPRKKIYIQSVPELTIENDRSNRGDRAE